MSRRDLRGMIAAIAAVSVFAFGLSLSVPLISINLERMGASGLMIGMNSGASAMAILAGGFIMPVLMRWFSVPMLMLGGVLGMAALLQIFPLWPDPWVWMGLRFIYGTVVTALFFCSEIWIITAAPPARRGLMIGIYGLFLSIGFLVGPLILGVIGSEGALPFIVGGALSLLALPPILIAWGDAPDLGAAAEPAPGPSAIIGFFRSDPAIMWAVVLFGVAEFGAMGLFPVWSLRIGLDEAEALLLVAMFAAGNVVMQIPMGWIGDRFDRRRLLGFCAFVSLAAAVIVPAISGHIWPLRLILALWGGLVVGLYTFSLNELGARYSGAALSRATGAVMTAYGVGALVAPPVLGAAMDAYPPHGMFGLMAAASLAYLALLTFRRRRAQA